VFPWFSKFLQGLRKKTDEQPGTGGGATPGTLPPSQRQIGELEKAVAWRPHHHRKKTRKKGAGSQARGGGGLANRRPPPPVELKITSVFDEVLFGKVGNSDVFLFEFGVIVAWGLSDAEMEGLKALLDPFVFQPASGEETEKDSMKYVYWDAENRTEEGRPPIRKDTFPLVTSNTFEKLAYSYGFAQSTKLSVFESIIDITIEKTKRIPESLARYGTTWMSRRNIAKQLGQLFVLRCNVNLQTDILDTPEILWDFDEWESLYLFSKRYLGVESRVKIVNQRLDVIKDLYDILNDELGVQQSHREGVIIIALISLELFVEIFKELLDIPAIADSVKNWPTIFKEAAFASPLRVLTAVAVIALLVKSPVVRVVRSLQAKWAYEDSLRVARAGGAMHVASEDDGMFGNMMGKLGSMGPGWGKYKDQQLARVNAVRQ